MNVLTVHYVNQSARQIFSEDELPEGQEVFIELNAELSQKWPNITQIGDQPADREEWNGKPDKLQYLESISKDQQSLIFLYPIQTFHCKFLVICALFCIKIAAIFISA